MDDQRARRQLDYLTLALQKSGHALAAYLVEATPSERVLLLLVPDEDLQDFDHHIAAAVGTHVQVTRESQPNMYRLLTESAEHDPRLHTFPASATDDYTNIAKSQRGHVLFDHPGVFTRRRD
jgi:hypothetical protein